MVGITYFFYFQLGFWPKKQSIGIRRLTSCVCHPMTFPKLGFIFLSCLAGSFTEIWIYWFLKVKSVMGRISTTIEFYWVVFLPHVVNFFLMLLWNKFFSHAWLISFPRIVFNLTKYIWIQGGGSDIYIKQKRRKKHFIFYSRMEGCLGLFFWKLNLRDSLSTVRGIFSSGFWVFATSLLCLM